jgi:hypothetical protein
MNYYESKDLDRFGEIGRFRGELAETGFSGFFRIKTNPGESSESCLFSLVCLFISPVQASAAV